MSQEFERQHTFRMIPNHERQGFFGGRDNDLSLSIRVVLLCFVLRLMAEETSSQWDLGLRNGAPQNNSTTHSAKQKQTNNPS